MSIHRNNSEIVMTGFKKFGLHVYSKAVTDYSRKHDVNIAICDEPLTVKEIEYWLSE